jgi:hypothetical protein
MTHAKLDSTSESDSPSFGANSVIDRKQVDRVAVAAVVLSLLSMLSLSSLLSLVVVTACCHLSSSLLPLVVALPSLLSSVQSL